MTFKKGDEVLIKGTVLSFEEGEIPELEIATSENTFFVNSEDVQVLPKKVVIPKFVAEWIEVCKEHLPLNISSAMDTLVLEERNQTYDLIRWMKKSKNKEIFARAWLDEGLSLFENNVERVHDLIVGKVKPQKCGRCDYCRSLKKLDRIVNLDDLIAGIF